MKKLLIVLTVLLVAATGLALYFFPVGRTGLDPAQLSAYAQTFCGRDNVTAVSLSSSAALIRVDSALLGGGSTYYRDPTSAAFSCPIVGPDAMSDACRELLSVTDWVELCSTPPVPDAEDAGMVVYGFLETLNTLTIEGQATTSAERLFETLASSARATHTPSSFASSAAEFVGIAPTALEQVTIEKSELVGTEALVTVLMIAGGTTTVRQATATLENDQWKVLRFDPVTAVGGVELEGNLVRSTPGRTSNAWHLTYETAGAPALTKELRFDEASVCVDGGESAPCKESAFAVGMRVRVAGTEENDVLQVVRLTLVK